ncbi:predicted protein [Naegleria gruberi]|uniref:Predicted protein n=1 Tax=Naegleria gruberi TaxID=5762 RepID=D2W175_NAEGR|nr:uncharacterized protein NAEGRDRAFT_53902 [Naegleria gruberi]EFC37134.1 predicted protein [Naegleria gruberi]|eukprot:XP_002669878.1 predicted protein [Naegleria gruberi strain NEG-M]
MSKNPSQQQQQPEHTIQLSDKVDQVLEEVLPQRDPFDSSFFDPVHYINLRFPNEQALNEGLESSIIKVKKKIQRVDEDILVAVRKQSSSGVQARRDLEEARETIQSLFKKINEIKSKAEQSEQMVQNITKDIKSLDYGKRNLTVTMTTLKRLHMLVSAVDKLTLYTQKKQYKQVAELLEAVNELLANFEKYKSSIPKVQNLFMRFESVKKSLRDQLFQDFKSLDAHKNSGRENVQQLLSEACLAVDALGDSIRTELISQFVKNRALHVYDMTFREGKEESKLERIADRYKWLMKVLKSYQEQFGDIFPSFWSVPQEITVEFSLMTRQAIVQMLQRGNNVSGKTLYTVILSTIKFERDMQERFYDPDESEILVDLQQQKRQLDQEEKLLKEAGQKLQEGSPEANDNLKKQFKIMIKRRELEKVENDITKTSTLDSLLKEGDGSASGIKEVEKAKKKPKNKYNFIGFISSCFEEHMSVYIEYEEESMRETLSNIIQKETWDMNSEYSSSQDLFMYIVESMKSCSALSKKKTLYDLVEKVFKKYLAEYAGILTNKLPKIQSIASLNSNAPNNAASGNSSVSSPVAGGSGASSFIRSLGMSNILPTETFSDKKIKLTDREEMVVFYIINSADYCQQNIEMVQDELKETLQEPYCDQVDLSEEQGQFYHVLKSGIEVLVHNLMNVMEKQFSEMISVAWGSMDTVGDQSPFISVIMQTLKDAIPFLAKALPITHFKFFCDNFVLSFMANYINNIYKCKKISLMGAQQLLVNSRSLVKYSIRELINLGDNTRFDEDDLASFARKVDGKAQKIECILRTLSAPNDLIAETYISLAPNDHSLPELTKILELKELQKNEKQQILEGYQKELRKRQGGDAKDAPQASAIGTATKKMEQATSAIMTSSKSFIKKFTKD